MHTTHASGTFLGVQALRFVAALLVVAFHVPTYVADRLGVDLPEVPTGQIGVAVFFAISGFVAVLVTSRSPRPSWRDFLRRRLVRIVPLAWLLTALKLGTALLAPGELQRATLDPGYVAASFLFLPARGEDGIVQPLYTVEWTLVLELAFYVVITIALLCRRPPSVVATVMLGALSVASVFRDDDYPAWQFYADPIVLCFLAGMVVAHWAADRRTGTAVARLGALVAFSAVVAALGGEPVGRWVLLPIAAMTLAAVVAAEPLLRRFVGPTVVTLGDASYALYLTHPVVAPVTVAAVGFVVQDVSPVAAALVAVVAVGVAVGAAVVVWFAVDRPLLRTLNRSLGRRRRLLPR